MGMCFAGWAVSDDTINLLHKHPPLIWRIVAPDDPEILEDAIPKPGFIGRLLGQKPAVLPDLPDGPREELDLDKSWDGLNFCLAKVLGAEWTNLLEAGNPVGDIEVGFGTASSITAAALAKIADVYKTVTKAQLLEAYKPADMAEVYPSEMWTRDDDNNQEYLIENLEKLQAFLAKATAQKLGIVVCVM